MSLFKKWLTVPKSTETKQVETFQTWEVRWESRFGRWHDSTQPEMEAFLTEEEARHFADALKAAFKLVKNTSENKVSVVCKSGGAQ